MSKNEFHTGLLVKINFPENAISFIDKLKFIKDNGIGKFEDVDEETEYFYSKEVFRHKGVFYQMKNHREQEDYEDIMEGEITPNGIRFTAKFYNGGCSLGEALETILEKTLGENNG